MNLLRKTTVLFLTIILAAAMPVVAHAAKGGGGGNKPSRSGNTSNSGKSNKKPAAQPEQPKPAPKIDINSATAAQLATLPGITDELAGKIVAARPFKSVSDLKGKKILTSAQYDAIKNLTVANKPPAPPKTPKAPAPGGAGDSGE